MDFCYHIQAYHIMDKDFDIVNATLHEFHLHKNSILDAGLCRGKANKPINNWHQAMPVISTDLVCSQLLYLVLSWSCISNTFVILLHPLYSVMITHYLLITLCRSYWTHGYASPLVFKLYLLVHLYFSLKST